MPFSEIDLLVDDDGDLEVASNGDLDLADESETVQQDILFRLKTEHLDYTPSPYIGADLYSITGEPLSERTCDLARELVHVSLTHDSRIPNGVLYVDCIPISINSVQIVVIITDRIGNGIEPVVVTQTLDLESQGPGDESILEVDE